MNDATLTVRTHSRRGSHKDRIQVTLPATVVLEVDTDGEKRRLTVDLDRDGRMDLSRPIVHQGTLP